MKSEQYWKERAERREQRVQKTERQVEKELRKHYMRSIHALENEAEAFYARYAESSGLDISEIRKKLRPVELKSYREQTKLYYDEVVALGLGNDDPDVKAYLRELSAKSYMSRLEALKTAMAHELFKLAAEQEKVLGEALEETYREEYLRALYDGHQFQGYGDAFIQVDPDAAEKAVREAWLGANYSARVWANREKLAAQLNTTVPRAMVLGRGPRELAKLIQDRMGTSFYAAYRLARTELIHAANEASFAAYSQLNGVERYRYLAALEIRTCEICGALDNKVFPLTAKEVGVNFPTIHPNCRCTTIPYWGDGTDDEGTRLSYDPSKGSRRTAQWTEVPADMTFTEWKEKFVQPAKKLHRKAPVTGSPNTHVDIVDDYGIIKQRRYYDAEGNAKTDVDLSDHGNSKHHPMGAHAHDWYHNSTGKLVRSAKARRLTDEEQHDIEGDGHV